MIQNSNFLTALQLQEQYQNGHKQLNVQELQNGQELSFKDILKNKANADTELKFSKHASVRLEQRGIQLTQGQMERLTDATTRAGQKGIKDSLVIVDELAFIVNVPNHTVITAMESAEAMTNVFTNIDGAVIM